MNYRNLLFFLFIFSNSVFAQESEFKEYFYTGEISSRHCGQNTSNFIDYLGDTGYPTSDVDTLVITAPGNMWSFGKVLAVNSRWGKENEGNYHENWSFHVVSIIRGYVYDFSFNKGPLILPLIEYLNRMFIPTSPLMLYGETFRIRNRGPWFTKQDAKEELVNYRFKILKTQSNGSLDVIRKDLNLKQLINFYSFY
jgi:hypothetical protein